MLKFHGTSDGHDRLEDRIGVWLELMSCPPSPWPSSVSQGTLPSSVDCTLPLPLQLCDPLAQELQCDPTWGDRALVGASAGEPDGAPECQQTPAAAEPWTASAWTSGGGGGVPHSA